ncbi:CRACD-like protein isoform X1 [Carassius gibelio]|uniref:CRACD-like protein isoform X1 n=1 Tax=Carassius gibelio TaxID=101364 RepID=UPI002278B3B2|nr:CRACD-like protein isoform X1 [Carassius gibelio]
MADSPCVKCDCDIMASGSPDITISTEPSEAAEECSGKKKSKFQTFKNFFVKKKRKESPAPSSESGLKASQSSDDVNTSEPTISHANSSNDHGSKMNLGSKAMSHDSVFVSDSPSSETNEGLGASQDNIHGKVKSLQLQLKQAIRLGSPQSLLCGRKGEHAGALSEDDGLPCNPPDYSSLHPVLATPPQTSVDLTQSSLSMEASDSEDDQMSCEASSRPGTPQGSVLVDFSLPASSISCLDSSAAHHRIAVKANACVKRKPVSKQILDKRRDLREKVLLRDTEDKLRMMVTATEEEQKNFPGEQVNDSDGESFASEQEEEEVTDSGQCQKTSPTSSISAGDFPEGEDHHIPKSEVPESSWESPVTLELQAEDFLLDTGCEVIPEKQGSLLEEVLSSLKSPLASGLALEHENMLLQREVEYINSESAVSRLEEDNKDLLDSSEPMVTPEEKAPLPDSLSEEEEQLEVPESADVQTQADEEDQELGTSPNAFAVNVTEQDEDAVEDEAEMEIESQDAGDEDDEMTAVEPEKREDSTDDVGGQTDSLEPEKEETSGDQRESAVENVPESDPTVRDDEVSDEPEASEAPPVEVFLSTVCPVLESPLLHSQFSDALMSPVEQEEEPESDMLDVSGEPQDVSSEDLEVVSEQQDQQVFESPTGELGRISEVGPRFTITPAWQRSMTSEGAQEQSQTTSPVPPETDASDEPPQTSELITPVKEELPKAARAQSSPAETSPENPFGVRLRKTPVPHRFGLDGESAWTPVQSSGAQETPDREQSSRKPILPKKPDLLLDTVMSARKNPDTVGRISVGSTESPSWISVARQKQRNFIENSPENSPEKLPAQGDVKSQDSPSTLSNPIVKEQLTQPCSPLQVFCSLELNNSSMVEKENKRSANPSAAPLAQDEPPWLALAKKKSKAWSEMPQIVQ